MNDDIARRLRAVGADDLVSLDDDDSAPVDVLALDYALLQFRVGDRELGEERVELGPAGRRRAEPAVGKRIGHGRTIGEQAGLKTNAPAEDAGALVSPNGGVRR